MPTHAMKSNIHCFYFFHPLGQKLFLWLISGLLVTGFLFPATMKGQGGVIPTKGKEFWVGFPYNPDWSPSTPTRRCDVFITAEIGTSGTISIPRQGWSQAFTVTANQTTTISLPVNQVENVLSEVVEDRGVFISTLDTVSVFAISFEAYTADATVVYPQQTTGTEYRISSYPGLSNASFTLHSDFLIVASADDTQIE